MFLVPVKSANWTERIVDNLHRLHAAHFDLISPPVYFTQKGFGVCFMTLWSAMMEGKDSILEMIMTIMITVRV